MAILIFDGNCPFCTTSADWIRRRLPSQHRVVPAQGVNARKVGVPADRVAASAWWVDADGAHAGHRAIGRALAASGGWRAAVGRIVLAPVLAGLAAAVYELVSENRRHLPGTTPACEREPKACRR